MHSDATRCHRGYRKGKSGAVMEYCITGGMGVGSWVSCMVVGAGETPAPGVDL